MPTLGPARKSVPERYPRLRLAIILIWAVFAAFSIYTMFEDPPIDALCAVAIATMALLPGYLWADGRVRGLPILPIHILTLLWTYALPLVAGHPEIPLYDPEEIGSATACVLLYAILASAVWAVISVIPAPKRFRFRVLPMDRGFVFFTLAIFAGGVFTALAIDQLIELDPGVYGIVRSIALTLATIATFMLSIRLGRGELSIRQRTLFLLAMLFFVVVQLATLYLVASIVTLASALIGFTIGSRRVPWVTVVLALLIFGFLHNGKYAMRERYWSEGQETAAKTWQIPGFFAEWIADGVRALGTGREGLGDVPIFQRVSLMHLLLLEQRSTPVAVPFLAGETYAIIPRLLMPRIFDPDKPDSHQGTAMLNMQFGLQNAEDVQGTTIGWGQLNEGYANFGLAGVAGVAVFLGLLFGFVGRLTAGAPVMSLESMIGVTFCAVALQTEFTMAVFATVLFQSMVVLALIVPFLELRRADETA